MTAPNLIPALDPNPLPAPYWVFQLLLFVTFFLHIVAMDLMVGGAVLAAPRLVPAPRRRYFAAPRVSTRMTDA